MIRCPVVFLLFLTIILYSSVAHAGIPGKIAGKVVDKDTGDPIAGAVVFMRFYTKVGTFGGPISYYADAVEVLTDKEGKFTIPARTVRDFRLLAEWEPYGGVIIFKPGYGAFPGHPKTGPKFMPSYSIPGNENVTIGLPRLKRIKERKRNLNYVSVLDNVPQKKWCQLFESINKERSSLGLRPL